MTAPRSPVDLAADVGPSPATPPGHLVRIDGTDTAFVVPDGERIHAAARRAGVWLPFECGWGSCGTCKATLVDGETQLLFPGAPAVDDRDARRRRIVLCQSTARSDAVVKPLRVDSEAPPERPTRDLTGRLVDAEPLGPAIASFRFDLCDADGAPVDAVFRPGQYAILEVAPGLRRCYSMAAPPSGPRVEFVAKHYAGRPGSGALFGLRPGAAIPVELPYGDMWLRPGSRPRLLIAGGTGISAILALLQGLAADAPASEPGGPVVVAYGAATRSELVRWEEVVELAGRLPGGRAHAALSDPEPGWTGTRGLVTAAVEEVLPEVTADGPPDVYLAGPPVMVTAVQDVLRQHGVQRDRIHVDSFG